MTKYIVDVIGGIWDGKTLLIESKYVLDKVISSLEYEGNGYKRCDITEMETRDDDNWFGDEDEWFK